VSLNRDSLFRAYVEGGKGVPYFEVYLHQPGTKFELYQGTRTSFATEQPLDPGDPQRLELRMDKFERVNTDVSRCVEQPSGPGRASTWSSDVSATYCLGLWT
jgi:hypothetical protein